MPRSIPYDFWLYTSENDLEIKIKPEQLASGCFGSYIPNSYHLYILSHKLHQNLKKETILGSM